MRLRWVRFLSDSGESGLALGYPARAAARTSRVRPHTDLSLKLCGRKQMKRPWSGFTAACGERHLCNLEALLYVSLRMASSTLLEDPMSPELAAPQKNEMDTSSLPLEEILQRLSQTREKGCLLVGSTSDFAEIFVRDGQVVAAACNDREGEAALQQIVNVQRGIHLWLPGEFPLAENLSVPLMGAALRTALAKDERKAGHLNTDLCAKRSTAYLIAGIDRTRRLALKSAITVLGRGAACDIQIDHHQVSRRHCLFDWRKQGLFVRDLDSTCGTEINGMPLGAGCYLQSGDKIVVGTFPLTLYFG